MLVNVYRTKGCEFGTTTSRPRRCGWLDLVVLRYAVRINGITEICLTKLDVLDELKNIKVCTAYQTEDGKVEEFPLDLETLFQMQNQFMMNCQAGSPIFQIALISMNCLKMPKAMLNIFPIFWGSNFFGISWVKAKPNHSLA